MQLHIDRFKYSISRTRAGVLDVLKSEKAVRNGVEGAARMERNIYYYERAQTQSRRGTKPMSRLSG